jgi:hypothetical protein
MPSLEPVGLEFLDRAEHVFTTDVDLPVSVDEVWEILVDNSSWTSWFACSSITSSVPVWADPGDTRTIRVGPIKIEEVAVNLDEPRQWAMSLTRSTIPLATRMLEVLDIRDTSRNGEERTEVKWTGALDIPVYLRPARGLIESRLVAMWGSGLEALHDEVLARRS